MKKSIVSLPALSCVLLAALVSLACEGPAPTPVPPPAPARDAGGSGGSTGTGGTAGRPMAGSGGAPGDAGGTGGMTGGPDANAPSPADGGPTRPTDARPMADAAKPDVSTPSDTGSAPSSDLDQRCTVPVTFSNPNPTSEGSKIFAASVPDAVSAMQAHARTICRILYRKVDEVKNVRQQRLTVEPSTEIAFAAGGNITFSTDYIADFADGKGKPAIDAELNGVLVHEGTHVWQYTNGGGALVEAMADYVRFKAGFYTLARRQRGGNWNQPYTTGGFFIAWVEEKYDPDYGYKLNMGMKDRGFSYPAFVQQVTGKSIDAVWAEYQAAIR